MVRYLSLISFAVVLGLAGCGSSGPELYPVSGEVTFNGQPLSQGEIVFRAPGEPSYAGKIVAGEYQLKSSPGLKRVEIIAIGVPTASSGAGSGEAEINFEVQIPPQYNSQSELTAEVTASDANEFDFPLTP